MSGTWADLAPGTAILQGFVVPHADCGAKFDDDPLVALDPGDAPIEVTTSGGWR